MCLKLTVKILNRHLLTYVFDFEQIWYNNKKICPEPDLIKRFPVTFGPK